MCLHPVLQFFIYDFAFENVNSTIRRPWTWRKDGKMAMITPEQIKKIWVAAHKKVRSKERLRDIIEWNRGNGNVCVLTKQQMRKVITLATNIHGYELRVKRAPRKGNIIVSFMTLRQDASLQRAAPLSKWGIKIIPQF